MQFTLPTPTGQQRRTPRSFAGIHLLLAVFIAFGAYLTFRVKIPAYPLDAPTHIIIPRGDQFHPDEPRHLDEIEYMAKYHWLPPFETRKEMQLYGDSYHPPLYHALCAVVWAIFAPLLGRSGCILLLRLLSVAMGAGTIYYAYRLARLLAPHSVALLSAACVAGVPMFVFTSASITNEMLNALGASVSLYYLVYGIRHGFNWRTVWLLSLWIAVGVSSKFTCVGLIPAAWFGLWWAGQKRGVALPIRLQQMALVGGVSTLAIGWFLIRNLMLYGDLFRLKAWTDYYGGDSDGFESHHLRDHISWKGYIALCTDFGWKSFWGMFDRLETPLPNLVYSALKLLHLASFVGWLRLLGQKWLRGDRMAAMLAMGIFGLVLIYEFFKFNWWHCSPQGRYFFPWLPTIGFFTAIGWLALFPRRARPAASAVLLAALLVLNVYCCRKYPSHPITQEHLDEKFQ